MSTQRDKGMEKVSRKINDPKLMFVLSLLSLLLILNFVKALPYKLLTYDGFQYLRMSESFWSFKFDYILPYRSPLISLLLIPNIKLARIELIFTYITLCFFFYIFVKEKLKIKNAIFSLILFSLCWWNILFTSEIATEYLSLFFLFLGFLTNNYLSRSIYLSFSFLVRPDSIIFILPFFLFLERDKRVIIFFIVFSFLIDIFLFSFFYKKFNVSFLNFFVENFFERTPWKISPGGLFFIRFLQILPHYALLLVGVLYMKIGKKERNFFLSSLFLVFLLGFLPFTNDRIFFLKILILASISGTFLLRDKIYSFSILFLFSFLNILTVVLIQYPSWLIEIECCPSSPFEFCSNVATSLFYESLFSN